MSVVARALGGGSARVVALLWWWLCSGGVWGGWAVALLWWWLCSGGVGGGWVVGALLCSGGALGDHRTNGPILGANRGRHRHGDRLAC